MEANKQLTAEVATLRERMGGLMNEKNEVIRLLKAAQRKIKRLEGLLPNVPEMPFARLQQSGGHHG